MKEYIWADSTLLVLMWKVSTSGSGSGAVKWLDQKVSCFLTWNILLF